ncbi:hypothetical protein TWF696_009490 [Orbilia brochopaga]|uniref:Uncharacterized protein n=1 Tax=Orbilia brochopaga TaxID=3140254 RepID=A0AAV9UBL4_9PEZI
MTPSTNQMLPEPVWACLVGFCLAGLIWFAAKPEAPAAGSPGMNPDSDAGDEIRAQLERVRALLDIAARLAESAETAKNSMAIATTAAANAAGAAGVAAENATMATAAAENAIRQASMAGNAATRAVDREYVAGEAASTAERLSRGIAARLRDNMGDQHGTNDEESHNAGGIFARAARWFKFLKRKQVVRNGLLLVALTASIVNSYQTRKSPWDAAGVIAWVANLLVSVVDQFHW